MLGFLLMLLVLAIVSRWYIFYMIYNRLKGVVRDFRRGNYYLPWQANDSIVISPSKKHLAELSDTPILSQRAAYADMFGFKHTMKDLDHHEHNIARYRLLGRLLQVKVQDNMCELYESVITIMRDTLTEELGIAPSSQGQPSTQCARMCRNTAQRMMSVLFFGETLASEKPFQKALLRYPQDMFRSLIAFQLVPSFLSEYVHKVVTHNGCAMQNILDRVNDIIVDLEAWKENETIKKHTVLYKHTLLSRDSDAEYWTTDAISQNILGIWFAASHQPWMFLNTIVLELCKRSEWCRILREEVGDFSKLSFSKLESLPLLDSFIKETIRHRPLDHHVVRRKALKSFTFSGGSPHIERGRTACISSYDILHDPKLYFDPYSFYGKRFVAEADDRSRKFTGVTNEYPVWGFGSLACPGRFYATFVIKLAVAYLVSNYELSLHKPGERTRWMWQTFTMPYERTRIVLRRWED